MQRFNKATAAAVAGAIATVTSALWPGLAEIDPSFPTAATTVLTVLFVIFSPKNKEPST